MAVGPISGLRLMAPAGSRFCAFILKARAGPVLHHLSVEVLGRPVRPSGFAIPKALGVRHQALLALDGGIPPPVVNSVVVAGIPVVVTPGFSSPGVTR